MPADMSDEEFLAVVARSVWMKAWLAGLYAICLVGFVLWQFNSWFIAFYGALVGYGVRDFLRDLHIYRYKKKQIRAHP